MSFSILRVIQVLSIPLNVSLLTCYFMINEFDIDNYGALEKFVFYFTLVLIILLMIACVMSLISVENEEEIYEKQTISNEKSNN